MKKKDGGAKQAASNMSELQNTQYCQVSFG
jgi:hypothetical protein